MSVRSLIAGLLALAPYAATAPFLTAQGTLNRVDGQAPSDYMGRSVAGVGDIDGDGFDDVIVGADGVDSVASESGSVRVVSGRNGAVLYSLDGNSIGDFFGYSVDGAGDVDGDGVPDFVIGAYGDDPANLLDAGAAYVYSGRTGTVIHTFFGDGLEDRFGFSVAGAGDVDADGFADVIVGAYSDDCNGVDSGCAKVFSGRDGSVLHTFPGDSPADFLGFAVDGAGDVDGDGHADLIVGMPGDDNTGSMAGAARVYSGRTGAVLHTFDGTTALGLSGVSVAGAGDVDGDGKSDVIVGALFAGDAGPNHGAAYVYRGTTGALLHTFGGSVPFSFFGYALDGAGDVDGDGHADLVVGAVLDSLGQPVAGSVLVYSGRTGAIVNSFSGTAVADGFGCSVASAGDADADGFADIVVGACFDDNSALDAGTALVIDVGATGNPARARTFGAACAGSDGRLPHVSHSGRAAPGTTIDLALRGALPNAPTTLNLGAPANVALDAHGMPGCTLYATVDGFVLGRMTDAAGMARYTGITVPNDPGIVGLEFVAQWVVADSAANPAGFTMSDAIRFRFGN